MKKIGLTLRIDEHKKINEYRDAIDQRWYCFLQKCGIFPVLIPNNKEIAEDILSTSSISGLILSGGNNLSFINDKSVIRDEVETFILQYAIQNNLPILGVCRGMQLIQKYFGVDIYKIQNHVATTHLINWNNEIRYVNSYHEYGTKETVTDLLITSKSEDDIIESIKHVRLPIKGIMWHPEREENFSTLDINLFKKHFIL